MKVIAKPVDVVAWFENKGIINPIKFRMTCDDDSYKVIKIDKVLLRDKEKITGNIIQIFRCSSVINGVNKIYELKYEINTSKWMLFKIE